MKRFLVSFAISCIISFIIILISNDFGIVWDEPIYFRNADAYVSWIQHPTLGDIEKSFHPTVTDAHPPFRKIIAGLTHEIFVRQIPLLDNTRAYRVSALFFVIPFITVFSYIAIGQFGYGIGMLIPFIYSFLPHVLFLTPLVTIDYAIAGVWFVAVVAAIKGMRQYRWLTISAICIGITMLMKLHGFLLFLPIGLYWLWFFWIKHKKSHKANAYMRLLFLLVIALVAYIVGWPWLWTHTWERLGIYFQIQIDHSNIPVFILGKIYQHAPWWYVPLMFATTTPLFIIISFTFGVIEVFRSKKIFGWVMLINALYPMIFFSLPWIYRYDWIRLFLASYPFICMLAGVGIMWFVRRFSQSRRRFATFCIIGIWLVTVYVSVIKIHPWESSYYNELVGGIRGASRLGFETEYWGNSYLGVLPWMNGHKNEMMCVWPTTHPFYYYQAMGMIESGVVFNAAQDVCKYAIVLMRQGLFKQSPVIESMVKNRIPVYGVYSEGVLLVGVYDTGVSK